MYITMVTFYAPSPFPQSCIVLMPLCYVSIPTGSVKYTILVQWINGPKPYVDRHKVLGEVLYVFDKSMDICRT